MRHHEHSLGPRGPGDEPPRVYRLHGTRPIAAHLRGRIAGKCRLEGVDSARPAHELGRLGVCRDRLLARDDDDPGDRDRPQPVEVAIEEDQEQHEPGPDEDARQGHADRRHGVLLDLPEQCEREEQGAEQHRQDELEDEVAVPDAHVARREGLRGHLDDEHGHRHDEAGQRDHRADDRREDRLGRSRRVFEPRRKGQPAVEPSASEAQQPPGHTPEQRHDPEVALEVLADPEPECPRHGRKRTSPLARPSGAPRYDCLVQGGATAPLPRTRSLMPTLPKHAPHPSAPPVSRA